MQPHTQHDATAYKSTHLASESRKALQHELLSQGYNEQVNTLDLDPDPESNTLPLDQGTAPMMDVIIPNKCNYLSILVDVENHE